MQRPRYDFVLYWVLGFLVVYVLSIGPVAALCKHHYLSFYYCEPVYRPVEWLYREQTPILGPALITYILWCEKF